LLDIDVRSADIDTGIPGKKTDAGYIVVNGR